MNPLVFSVLWPVVERALQQHLPGDSKQTAGIIRHVRGQLDTELAKEAAMLSQANAAQHQLNRNALNSGSVFLAGWRPLAGWSCALGVFWVFLGAPVAQAAAAAAGLTIELPQLPRDHLFELLCGLLGMSGIRSFDKMKGR